MKKKKWILFAIFMVMMLGTAARVYATAKQITAKDLKNLKDPAIQTKISQILVEDMGKSEVVDPRGVHSVMVTYGRIASGDNNVVVVVNFENKVALAGVYKKANGVYSYLDDMGVFFDVEEVNTVHLKNLGKDAVFLKEYVQQNIGALERTTFLRGYLWEEDEFQLIYSMPEQVQADWNQFSESDKGSGESQWNRIIQTSKTTLENGNYPVIKAQRDQSYLKSSDTSAQNIPEDATFCEVTRRRTSENYYWSDSWKQFIINEKIEKTTGEKVAVVEDLTNLPYSIVQDFEAYCSKVRIVRKDGTTDLVEKDLLSDGKENKNTIEET